LLNGQLKANLQKKRSLFYQERFFHTNCIISAAHSIPFWQHFQLIVI